jgi:hypothetical protein
MSKRRIRITREYWRRVRIQVGEGSLCPGCRRTPDLVRISDAAALASIDSDVLDGAVRSGSLPAWNLGPEQLVCLFCVENLGKRPQ